VNKFDSVMISLSKGLGAPVGSVLCAGRALITEARRVRKAFGGGMRPVGVLAAAARVALERATGEEGGRHLAEDHAHARHLAEVLAELPGIEVDPESVQSNIVIFGVGAGLFAGKAVEGGPGPALVAALAQRGVLAVALSPERVRFVTHRDVPRAKIERAAAALREIAAG